MIRLAIVGPLDSVKLILEVVTEQRDAVEAVPIVYQDASEVVNIISSRDSEVDVWLFSGKVPYSYAINAHVTQKPLLYIQHTGTSLYRALFQMTYHEKIAIDHISFDTFSRKEIEEAFADIEYRLPTIYINNYQGVISAKEITEFHYGLWKRGQSQVAVTCFLSTYIELKKRGVPVFRIWPTRDNVRMMLDIALRTSEALRFKTSQIAIQIIEIDKYGDFVRGALSVYDVKRVEARLYDLLVDYAEIVNGSIVVHGNGQYTIYSTRGIVEEITCNFTVMPILEEMTRRLKVSVSGGIGFGKTAYAAEEHARIALGLSRRQGQGVWMVVLDDRSVVGPLSSETQIRYSIRGHDAQIRDLAQRLRVSATTVNRLFAAIGKLDGQVFSADDVALYLSMTARSARRLLAGLVNLRLASVASEEVVAKGRPRKLYEIRTKELVAWAQGQETAIVQPATEGAAVDRLHCPKADTSTVS